MSDNEQESTQKALRLPLSLLQAFVGLTTSAGGILLMVDPSGGLLDLQVEWLYETPFNDYMAPGAVLFLFFGIGHLLGTGLSIRRARYAGEVAGFFGMAVMVWVMIQVWVFLSVSWLQPFYFTLGGIEFILGIAWLRTHWSGSPPRELLG